MDHSKKWFVPSFLNTMRECSNSSLRKVMVLKLQITFSSRVDSSISSTCRTPRWHLFNPRLPDEFCMHHSQKHVPQLRQVDIGSKERSHSTVCRPWRITCFPDGSFRQASHHVLFRKFSNLEETSREEREETAKRIRLLVMLAAAASGANAAATTSQFMSYW